jgi:DNA-directed RNA polymerase subunit H
MSPPTPRRPSARSAKAKAKAEPKPPRPAVVHQLVPPHELQTEEESRVVLTELDTPAERLPKILLSDPGLTTDPKFRAAKEAREQIVGRLVRVRRPSPTAGEAIAYRLVVAGVGD